MKVLAYSSPAKGHAYPLTPIVATLAQRGHEVSVRTLPSEIGHLASLGVDAKPIAKAILESELDDWRASSPVGAIVAAMKVFVDRARHEVGDLDEALAEERPDVAVIDVNCWGAAIAAERWGGPWAMFAPYLLPLPSRDVPPFGLGLAPLKGPLGRARNGLVRAMVRPLAERHGKRPLNAMRAACGLAPLERFEDCIARAPLILALTAEGFEYRRSDWPPNVRLVGPVNWGPPQPKPPWLDEMPEPLVLVTCSTERQEDAALARAALAGLPAEGFTVLATTAAHDPVAFAAPPPSRVVSFLAHEHALERAACVVCHGGMGIVQKALSAGVPLVVVPFGRDQLETARRVEVAKAGVRLSPRRLTPARLAGAVRTAIACRPGAQRVGELFAAAGGASAAAEAIEALASSALASDGAAR